MDIVQTFYDNLAPQYDKLFLDWENTTVQQAEILKRIFEINSFDTDAKILDCACGIGTQSIGLARIGYRVTASDISPASIDQAKQRAEANNVEISFNLADFRVLEKNFTECFDIVIAMDNALAHMLTKKELKCAIGSISSRVSRGGIFVASIRDYDALLADKPPYSPPYIHSTESGQRVSFQTWSWDGDVYKLIQYIIDDGNTLEISKFECRYRAVLRSELTDLLIANNFRNVSWLFPEETGFYQPIVVAKK